MGNTTQPVNAAVETNLALSVGPPGSISGAGSVSKNGSSGILLRIPFAVVAIPSDSLHQLQLAGWTYILALASRRRLFYLFIFLITKY
jgi:hypothetical protein